jgi:crotonobetainyl-CoA:carnitine CoA-transferase CaiB-like acyl-CoA transferase
VPAANGLINCSISGFGQDGPYHKRPGFDQYAQGMGGLMSIAVAPGEGPMRVGIPVADLTAGLFCAMGVLSALLERDVSGQVQGVQTSLLHAQIFMLNFQAARWLMEQDVPQNAGNNHPTSTPTACSRPRTTTSTSPPPAERSGFATPRRSASPN